MTCQNCTSKVDGVHEDWCHSGPIKVAARVKARADVAAYIDGAGFDTKAAVVWRFYDAPAVMRSWDLSSQDDADYIGIFPPAYGYPMWAEEGTSFGCFDVDVIELPNGWCMRVGFHS